jgi:hypothetical protein
MVYPSTQRGSGMRVQPRLVLEQPSKRYRDLKFLVPLGGAAWKEPGEPEHGRRNSNNSTMV